MRRVSIFWGGGGQAVKCEVLVDIFTFSVKVNNPVEVNRDWLGMEPDLFQSFPYGLNGYLQSMRFSSIIVCYNGYADDDEANVDTKRNGFFSRDDMGVCVSMSGNGCRTFERFSSLGFTWLFRKHSENMVEIREDSGKVETTLKKRTDCLCNVSRIDVACDDKAGLLDMSMMLHKAYDLHEFNSRMRDVNNNRSKKGDDSTGCSLYIGSSTSSFRMRIYDKALEQKQKGNWTQNAKGDWIRVEMVMRDENARGFVAQAAQAESIGRLAGQVLNDKFRFIERDNKNISRCSVSDWWAAFVDEVERLVIWSRSVIQHPIYQVEWWIRSQVATSMAMIGMTMGWSRLYDIMCEGKGRLSRKQEALVHDFRADRDVIMCEKERLNRKQAALVSVGT